MSNILEMKASIIVYPVIIILVVGIFATEYSAYQKNLDGIEQEPSANGMAGELVELAFSPDPIIDYLEENTHREFVFNMDGTMMTKMQATLAWADEPPQTPMLNLPDNFQLVIVRPSGERTESDMVPFGAITIFSQMPNGTWEEGDWTVSVICGDCGDQQGILRSEPDNGNEYILSVTYWWLEEV
jgi:hypothetical protein